MTFMRSWLSRSVRAKIILIVILNVIAISVAIYALSQFFILKSFAEIEKEEVTESSQQVALAVENQGTAMLVKSRDWGNWDDAYNFTRDPVKNALFIAEQIPTSTLSVLQINVLMYVDSMGKVVFKQVTDLEDGHIVANSPIPDELATPNKHLLFDPSTGSNDAFHGIVTLPEGPILVAVVPVLPNSMLPPNAGTLIFGRFIDKKFIDEISKITHLPLTAFPVNEPLQADVASAVKGFEASTSTSVVPLSNEMVAGYSKLTDLSGKPAIYLRIIRPRDIFNSGRSTLLVFIEITAIMIIGLGTVIVFLLNKTVIARLVRLTREVLDIGSRKDAAGRVDDPVKDEVGMLADAINSMLSDLTSAEGREHEARKLEAESTGKLKERIEEIERMNSLMTGRELKMIELKETIRKLRERLGEPSEPDA